VVTWTGAEEIEKYMKLINKIVKDLYPDAELIYSQDRKWVWLSRFSGLILISLVFCTLAAYVIMLFVPVFNLDYRVYLMILLTLFIGLEITIWSEHWITEIYHYKDVLIFSLMPKYSVIVNISEISYILLNRLKLENNEVQFVKWKLFSLEPGVIFQVGLFRFSLRSMNSSQHFDAFPDSSFIADVSQVIKKLNKYATTIKIINNYNAPFRHKHEDIDTKLHFQRFVCMLKYIFIGPIVVLYKAVARSWKKKNNP